MIDQDIILYQYQKSFLSCFRAIFDAYAIALQHCAESDSGIILDTKFIPYISRVLNSDHVDDWVAYHHKNICEVINDFSMFTYIMYFEYNFNEHDSGYGVNNNSIMCEHGSQGY